MNHKSFFKSHVSSSSKLERLYLPNWSFTTKINEITPKSNQIHLYNGENTEDEMPEMTSLTSETKNKKTKPKKKPIKKLTLTENNLSNGTFSIASVQNVNSDIVEKKQKKDTKSKKFLSEKEKSAKKTRLKNKFLYSIVLVNRLTNMRLPASFYKIVKKARLELIQLDAFQQQCIIDIANKLSKEELALMLFLIAETTDEIRFLKETMLTKQFFDILFRNIDNSLID